MSHGGVAVFGIQSTGFGCDVLIIVVVVDLTGVVGSESADRSCRSLDQWKLTLVIALTSLELPRERVN